MPDIDRDVTTPKPDAGECRPARSAHGIPDVGRASEEIHGRGAWYRIFGLIHMLGSAEDDGPTSRIRY